MRDLTVKTWIETPTMTEIAWKKEMGPVNDANLAKALYLICGVNDVPVPASAKVTNAAGEILAVFSATA